MARDIKLEIDGKLHKLMDSDRIVVCSNCSLNNFCENICKAWCIAGILGGEYFVELNVEK